MILKKMIEKENEDAKWSENKIDGEETVKTERVASRNATEEAEQLGNKLLELENMLKQEAKSRNRAEKKLKLLVKKLQSMNISYVTINDSEKVQESETGSNQDPSSPTVSHISDQNTPQCNTIEELSDDQSLIQEDDQDHDSHIDEPMALIAVDTPRENQTVDPEILDQNVKEVLDALRIAKEQLQSSMERRRMIMIIKVG